ncbi:hypothetical protein [Kitasatospora sp. NPDC059571]|uniref:hypothetical protein n=1 Tax=Kitasatospora sp. NPDC059571 TaxID=3346871 RepID=UPI0036797373
MNAAKQALEMRGGTGMPRASPCDGDQDVERGPYPIIAAEQIHQYHSNLLNVRQACRAARKIPRLDGCSLKMDGW